MNIIVSAAGDGRYTSLQAAIDSIPAGYGARVTIQLKPGIYEEKISIGADAPPITLAGSGADTTIISWSDNAHMPGPDGKPMGTFRTGTFNVYADGFTAEDITIRNTSGPLTGQAVAALIEADKVAFRRVRLLGDQDTLYTKRGLQYYEQCYIEGDVDYIFGSATCLFTACHMNNKRSEGFITAASTPEGTEYGYVFLDCRITGGPGVKDVYLGRPWRPFAHVAFIRTEIDESIIPSGWDNWRDPEREKTSRYEEFGSTGPGANPDARVEWSRQLNEEEAGRYLPEHVLGGWQPE